MGPPGHQRVDIYAAAQEVIGGAAHSVENLGFGVLGGEGVIVARDVVVAISHSVPVKVQCRYSLQLVPYIL